MTYPYFGFRVADPPPTPLPDAVAAAIERSDHEVLLSPAEWREFMDYTEQLRRIHVPVVSSVFGKGVLFNGRYFYPIKP